jgi:hypothetical protein
MVQTNGYAPQGGQPDFSGEDPFAFINGGKGSKSISFQMKYNGQPVSAPVGTAFTGVVAENPQVVPQFKYSVDDNAPKVLDTWPDGNPKKQVRVTLKDVLVFRPDFAQQQWQDVRVLNESEADAEGDEGNRTLFIKDQMKQALADAQKAANAASWGIGTRITVRLIDLRDTNKGFPQKIYAIELSEIQPYVADATIAHQNEMAGALQQGAPQQWSQQAPADPSQGYVTPAAPTFPGQVVPQQLNPAVPAAPIPQANIPAPAVASVVQQPPAPSAPVLPNTGAQLAPQVPQQVAQPPQQQPDLTTAVMQLRAVEAQGVPRQAALEGTANALGIPVQQLDEADGRIPRPGDVAV